MRDLDEAIGKFVRIGYNTVEYNNVTRPRAYPAWLPGVALKPSSSEPYLFIPHGSVVLLISAGYDFSSIFYGEQVLFVHSGHLSKMTSEEVEEWANAQPQV